MPNNVKSYKKFNGMVQALSGQGNACFTFDAKKLASLEARPVRNSPSE